MEKEIRSLARKLGIRLRKYSGVDFWWWKMTQCGTSEQTLDWLKANAVRKGILPTTALPPEHPIRQYTEWNGIDQNHKL